MKQLDLFDSVSKRVLPHPTQDLCLFTPAASPPYAHAHIGHGRSFVVFDAMVKLFEATGQKVEFVRNITDIDDKILKKAKDLSWEWQRVPLHFAQDNRRLFSALDLNTPEEPKATDHIPQIIGLIGMLIEKGLAYHNGWDVLFRAQSFSGTPLMEFDHHH